MYRRMRTCLFGFIEQAERHKLDSEIVLVDWNPPRFRPLLTGVYRWPKKSNFCSVRIIIVPPNIHCRYKDWRKTPVNNNVGQNVAIRRAKGTFILSTNIDVLLSNELVCFLASRKLDEETLYRASRYDVDKGVTKLKSLDQQLTYCVNNVIQVNPFLMDASPYLFSQNAPQAPGLHTGAPGDFILMAKEYWRAIRGYPEIDLAAWGCDTLVCFRAYGAGVKIGAIPDSAALYHIDHRRRIKTYHTPRIRSLSSNFWIKTGLRGLLPQGLVTALRETGRKFLWPSNHSKVPHLSLEQVEAFIIDILSKGQSYSWNDASWGLGNEDLKEFVVVGQGDPK